MPGELKNIHIVRMVLYIHVEFKHLYGLNTAFRRLTLTTYSPIEPSYPSLSLITLNSPLLTLVHQLSMGFDFTVYRGSKAGKIIQSTTHKSDLAPNEVLVKVTHSGLCGTDIHQKHRDIVLGHEGVGIVQEIGKDVRNFKVCVVTYNSLK